MRKEELKNLILGLEKEALEMSLGDLCEKVLKGEYTPGIHDTILLERCKKKDLCKCKKHEEENQDYSKIPYPYEYS